MNLLLLHGWGFSADFWGAMLRHLPDFAASCWDRGYFGAANADPALRPHVAIGHSLGALLLAEQLPPAVPLLVINGFDRFTGADAVPPAALHRMQRGFARAPGKTLTGFQQWCGAPPTTQPFDAAALAADLEQLGGVAVKQAGRRMLVLHGAHDPVLPSTMRGRVFPDAPRLTHDDGGHLLPLTHSAWCAEQVRAFACG